MGEAGLSSGPVKMGGLGDVVGNVLVVSPCLFVLKSWSTVCCGGAPGMKFGVVSSLWMLGGGLGVEALRLGG